jgi:glutathione peroxidase-family protein
MLLPALLRAGDKEGIEEPMKNLYDFTMKDIDGKDTCLSVYSNQVVLVVNVASRCGFTPQYAGLEKLYGKYKERGFVVLGFPANDFLGQEPGSEAEIKSFCSLTYSVTFPLFSKISVKGKSIHPLYAWMTDKKAHPGHGGGISWNFNKFLFDRKGNIINRFGTREAPESEDMVKAIEKALGE